MRGRRRTDPRSPVQPDRLSIFKLGVVAVLGVIAVMTMRDSWFDTDLPPSGSAQGSSEPAPQPSPASSRPRSARGNLTGLFSGDDYPQDALRNGEEGRATVRLDIDSRGRVSTCTVVGSSGSKSLDEATCSVLRKRARFEPARDGRGRPAPDTYTQTIVWQLR